MAALSSRRTAENTFFGFHATTGGASISYAVQVLIAAALTKVANGLYYDTNNDEEGIPAGERLNDIVRANIENLDDTGATPFTTWPPLAFLTAEQLTEIFQPVIDAPKVEKKSTQDNQSSSFIRFIKYLMR